MINHFSYFCYFHKKKKIIRFKNRWKRSSIDHGMEEAESMLRDQIYSISEAAQLERTRKNGWMRCEDREFEYKNRTCTVD